MVSFLFVCHSVEHRRVPITTVQRVALNTSAVTTPDGGGRICMATHLVLANKSTSEGSV